MVKSYIKGLTYVVENMFVLFLSRKKTYCIYSRHFTFGYMTDHLYPLQFYSTSVQNRMDLKTQSTNKVLNLKFIQLLTLKLIERILLMYIVI